MEAERLDYSTDARGRLVTIESQLTNDPGEYRLISVRPGEYYVRTNVDNYRIKTPAGSDASTYFPGMSDMSKAERILVGGRGGNPQYRYLQSTGAVHNIRQNPPSWC